MSTIRKPAAVAAVIAATLVGTAGAAAGVPGDDTDGYTWSNRAPTGVPADDAETDGYTWAD